MLLSWATAGGADSNAGIAARASTRKINGIESELRLALMTAPHNEKAFGASLDVAKDERSSVEYRLPYGKRLPCLWQSGE